jgi:uncharacterized protein (TIGR02145 family)
MGKIVYILIFTSTTINTFSQEMVVQKTDGSNLFIDLNTISLINFIVPCPGTPTVDYGGKIYNTVLVGDQCWLKENLDVGTMINGGIIQSNNLIIEKYCYNNEPSNCTTYGGLYQWFEAMQYVTFESAQGICPTDWHIPTLTEFQILAAAVENDGNALKAIGQGSEDGVGTNTSGFSALLAGCRYNGGIFENLELATLIWSSKETGYDYIYADYLFLPKQQSSVNLYANSKYHGFGVRCIKD